MKTYTVRFRCKARLEDEESTTESDYELQLEAENLEESIPVLMITSKTGRKAPPFR